MRFLLPLLLLAATASAQTPGLDYLGGAKFCGEILRNHPQGWAAGFFIDTFGDATPCIRDLLRTGKTDLFRVHLQWEDDHRFDKKDFDAIAAKARKLDAIVRDYPQARILVSGACEHNLNSLDAKLLRAKVLANCPRCYGYVNTPWRGATIDHLNEVHGQSPRKPGTRYLVSYDGVSATDSDVTTWKQNFRDAEILFSWIPQFNGRMKVGDKTPRPQRKAFAGADHIKLAAYQFENLAGASIPKGHILKPMSDQHGAKCAGKDCKPVYITDVKTKPKQLQFRTRNGVVISKSSGPQPFNGDKGKLVGWRYYFPEWGHVLSDKAKRAQGDALCEVFADGRRIGRAVPAGRAGTFR